MHLGKIAPYKILVFCIGYLDDLAFSGVVIVKAWRPNGRKLRLLLKFVNAYKIENHRMFLSSLFHILKI